MRYSNGPYRLKKNWTPAGPSGDKKSEFVREKLGRFSLFNWHCWRPMRILRRFTKTKLPDDTPKHPKWDGWDYRDFTNGAVCTKCSVWIG